MTTSVENSKIYIHLINARDVLIADKLTKSSDPYVKISGSGLLSDLKSDVKKGTLNPDWDEKFETKFSYKLNELKFKVYDKDKFGDKDSIGKAILPLVPYLVDGQEHEFSLPLLIEKGEGARRYKGEVNVKVRVEWGFTFLMPNTWLQCNERQIVVGIGWDVAKKKKIDLDASIAALDGGNRMVDTVSFKHLKGLNGALVHSGDNRTGEGKGDDEQITIDFALMPPNVEKLVVVVNLFSGGSFMDVKSAYFRVSSKAMGTQGFYRLSDMSKTTGVLMGLFLLNRENGFWYYQSIGRPVGGSVLMQSLPNVVNILGGVQFLK